MEPYSKLIYIADDELNIRRLIESFLKKDGYDVVSFATGDDLYAAFETKPADLVILDVMMPGRDGLSICYALRQISTVPIIMLTAKDEDADYVAGITLGSDDYFTKPVSPTVLSMRVKAIFRRIELDQSEKESFRLRYGDIEVYPDQKTALCKGEKIPLTLTEFNVLHYLFENADKAISREEMLNKVWGYDSIVETRATDDTIKRLRRKLACHQSNTVIETVWGYGFKLGRGE